MEYKYRAFISYRHISPDQEIAKRLHTLLETYRIPKNIRQGSSRTIGKIFRDNEELPISPNLSKNIEAALESSEWFIAVCSPQYQESKWCMANLLDEVPAVARMSCKTTNHKQEKGPQHKSPSKKKATEWER